MKIIGKTDIGRNRAENQDTFRSGCLPGVGCWGVVCDGVGGAENGRLASAVAADCIEEMLLRQLTEQPDGVSPQLMLRYSLERANAEVYERSGQGDCVMGTTAVCALAQGSKLYLAHVGDSRAYLLENGMLRQVTRDHSMVQELVDQGILTGEEAARHPERNVVTRALGVEGDVEPSYGEYTLRPGTVVLLCSDGLTNMVSSRAITEIMQGSDFYGIPSALVDAALAAGGDDNITVLVMLAEEEQ